ncbi:MAG: acyl-CoA dehydrogenase family protein [Gammaproteobacteria bacterium]
MPDTTFLGWPFFDDAHREWAETLDAWCQTTLEPLLEGERAAEHDRDALDRLTRALVAALGRDGWLKPCVPAEFGGTEPGRLDVRRLCLARETLARHSGLADFAFAMQGLGTGAITLFGTDAQRQRYLPPVVKGERIAAFAISEPDAGSDPAAMTTRAERDGGGYRIDGTKAWISNAGIADHYLLFARTGEAGARGISAFIVPADAPGLTISERIDVIAPHPLGTLTFDECRISGEQRLGNEGEGFKIAMATLDIFRATVGAAALGFARRALDEALAFSERRRIGGQPLADYQMTQAKLADMAVKIDAAALLVYRAAWTKDVLGQRVSREAAMAKYYATEAAQQVIDQAVQIHGGLGVVRGAAVERLYREIRALRIYEGTSEIQQLIIAGQLRQARKE